MRGNLPEFQLWHVSHLVYKNKIIKYVQNLGGSQIVCNNFLNEKFNQILSGKMCGKMCGKMDCHMFFAIIAINPCSFIQPPCQIM